MVLIVEHTVTSRHCVLTLYMNAHDSHVPRYSQQLLGLIRNPWCAVVELGSKLHNLASLITAISFWGKTFERVKTGQPCEIATQRN